MDQNFPSFECTWNPKFYEVSCLFEQLMPAWRAIVNLQMANQSFRSANAGCAESAEVLSLRADLDALGDFPPLSLLNKAFAQGPLGFVGSGCGIAMRCVEQVVLASRGIKNRLSPSALEANYQIRLFLQGEIMTRKRNWHDLFNALCHLTFPRTKAVINSRQFWALDADLPQLPWPVRPGKNRNAEQDALTHFDEGGVVVAYSDPEVLRLLKSRRWKEAFWEKRERLSQRLGFFVVGHALYEDVLANHPTPHGLALEVAVDEKFFEQNMTQKLLAIDQLASLSLSKRQCYSSTADFFPMPILGYPGWSPLNDCQSFYENSFYFR